MSAAQRLAENLERYKHGTRRLEEPQTPTVQGKKVHIEAASHGPSNVNPWLVVPRNPVVKHPVHPKAAELHRVVPNRRVVRPRATRGKITYQQGRDMLQEGKKILAHRLPKRKIEVRQLRPGQKLPKGAKVLPRTLASKLVGSTGVLTTQALNRVMLDDAEPAAEGDEGNSTDTGPPRDEIGDTGMTAEELKTFAESEKAKAKYLLQAAESERNTAMAELEDSRNMIAKGWKKHNTADETWADAEKHMANSTMLFSTYQRELATAKAEKEGSLAEKMETIATQFAEDAAEKHATYEEALGEAPTLDLVPYGMDAANATNTTGAGDGAEPAGEAAV